jgi:hypothetical protein
MATRVVIKNGRNIGASYLYQNLFSKKQQPRKLSGTAATVCIVRKSRRICERCRLIKSTERRRVFLGFKAKLDLIESYPRD